MAFPTSPTNGQTYTQNNVTYVYNSTTGVWDVQGVTSVVSGVTTVAGRSGVVTLTAADIGAGTFPGALVAGSTLSVNGATTLAGASATSMAVTGAVSGYTMTTGGLQAVAIGNVTPGTGSFTTLAASGAITGASLSVSGAISASSLTGISALNGVSLGASSPSTGAFTTLSASSTLTIGGASTFNSSATYSGNNAITFGPNSSWSAYLKVGGNGIDGTTAQIAATNGNLHLESLGGGYPIYLNYYRGGGVIINGQTNVTGAITATTTVTAYYSDERLKTKIASIENALDKIDQLSGFLYMENDLAKSFGFKSDKPQVALSAQAVQRIQPEATALAPFDRDSDGNSKSGENYLTVMYERLVPLLVEGIKELRREINQLKGK